MSAAERRIAILEAAVAEYGHGGIHATSTEAIAARAGISQPYLFRLFGTKTDLICAAIDYQTDKIRTIFRTAVENRPDGISPLRAIGTAYVDLLLNDFDQLRCQLHTWAAASDPALSEAASRSYRTIWEAVSQISGAETPVIRKFMAYGQLLTVLGSLDQLELFGDFDQALQEF